ncbi:MAG TPA: rhamnulokinase family protein [Pirellulaceae bacterium]|nr:rhamnulokinase family protein [Pirellulaceae bacterium]
MSHHIHLAVDLGAESGRVMAVWLDGGRVQLHEEYRFGHDPLSLPSGLHWNITGIWQGILMGLQAAAVWAREQGHTIRSVGVDAWGVDWGLLDRHGELVALPHAYRDPRNQDTYRLFLEQFSAERIYRITGIQLMPINTLFSLKALADSSPEVMAAARHLVFIPDLFHFWLSGEVAVEKTIASTSQLVDIQTRRWSETLVEKLGIPSAILGDMVPAGTDLGPVRRAIADKTGLSPKVRVMVPASHDTASAVASVPATGSGTWAFLSSGTWSLLGTELQNSCTSEQAQRFNFTNEAGVGESIRFLKNIAGLWLVQECRRAWQAQGQEVSYAELADAADCAVPWRTIVDPDAPEFQQTGQMLEKIGAFASKTNQPVPESPGQFARCALESLALAYRRTLNMLEGILGYSLDCVHIVGGGSQNRLLNQLTASLCQRPVIAGPVEATAIGNGLIQALVCGELASLAELREVVANSHLQESHFDPQPISWDLIPSFDAAPFNE